jgi:DNA-binding response OmpR family regulator
MKILVVEDQENLAKLVKKGLESEGFAVDYVTDGETASTRIEMCKKEYDIIILDLMLPKKDGIQVCKEVRAKKIATPILMLTAKDSAEDIIAGLNAGADDYLIKPFSFEILLARIRALLRRPELLLPTKLQIQHITLDPASKKVFKKNKEIKLTLKEFSLLEFLMRNPDHALRREQILSNVWDFAFDSLSNVVDVHVTSLRKKLGDKKGLLLETVRGVGYKINSKEKLGKR